MKLSYIFKFTFLFALLAGCSTTKIKNFDQYQTAPILTNPLFDKKTDLRKTPDIVVLPFPHNNMKQAKSAKIGIKLATTIENVISQNKLANILDRSAFKNLANEISLIEMSDGSKAFSGPETADYAISGNISSAHLESKYVAGSNYYDFANGRFVSIPPKFKYEATVTGNVKIYQLPSLETVITIPFNGQKFRTENAPKTGHIFARKVDMSALKKEDIGLLSDAAQDAIDDIKSEIKNFLGSLNKAYIFARKINKKRNIFQISMGSNNGLKPGEELIIYTIQETHNPLDDSTIIEEIKLGKAIVSEQISSKSAWIISKDKKLNEKIKLGDFVKRTFKKSFTERLEEISDKTNSILY